VHVHSFTAYILLISEPKIPPQIAFLVSSMALFEKCFYSPRPDGQKGGRLSLKEPHLSPGFYLALEPYSYSQKVDQRPVCK